MSFVGINHKKKVSQPNAELSAARSLGCPCDMPFIGDTLPPKISLYEEDYLRLIIR